MDLGKTNDKSTDLEVKNYLGRNENDKGFMKSDVEYNDVKVLFIVFSRFLIFSNFNISIIRG